MNASEKEKLLAVFESQALTIIAPASLPPVLTRLREVMKEFEEPPQEVPEVVAPEVALYSALSLLVRKIVAENRQTSELKPAIKPPSAVAHVGPDLDDARLNQLGIALDGWLPERHKSKNFRLKEFYEFCVKERHWQIVIGGRQFADCNVQMRLAMMRLVGFAFNQDGRNLLLEKISPQYFSIKQLNHPLV